MPKGTYKYTHTHPTYSCGLPFISFGGAKQNVSSLPERCFPLSAYLCMMLTSKHILGRLQIDPSDPYLDSTLDIMAAQSVNHALRELEKPKKLDGEDAHHCNVCLKKVPATKRLTLHSTPRS